MTNAEFLAKIKAEIERLYNGEAPKHDQQCNFDDGYFTGIDTISQFIDALESEKPMDELEGEIKRWWGEEYMKNSEGLPILPIVQDIARYFAKWGAEHLADARKTSPSDLEEAAGEYAEKHGFRVPYDGSDNFYDDVDVKASKEGFIAGAKWDMEQHKSVPEKYAEMDFESARNTFSEDVYNHNRKNKIPIDMVDLDDAFETGAEWMEKHILKKAMEGWVAVDSDTDGKRRVTFFPQKPVRDVLTEYKYWAATRPRYESIKLDSNAFPNLKWEDEPKKVRVIIVKENEKRVQNN